MTEKRLELNKHEIQKLCNFANDLADHSRKIIRDFRITGFGISEKIDKSVVSEVDLAIETYIRQRVREEHPSHGVLGEELGHTNKLSDFQWVLDPIDGTAEFVKGLPFYGTIIGLFYKQRPIVGIVDHDALNERYTAGFGLGAFRNGSLLRLSDLPIETPNQEYRIATSPPCNLIDRIGNAELFHQIVRHFPNLRIFHSCYTQSGAATGAFDASIELCMRIWDLAAVQILIEEAGGVCNWLTPISNWAQQRYSVIIGRPSVVSKLSKIISVH